MKENVIFQKQILLFLLIVTHGEKFNLYNLYYWNIHKYNYTINGGKNNKIAIK